jgi:hypothetical protein
VKTDEGIDGFLFYPTDTDYCVRSQLDGEVLDSGPSPFGYPDQIIRTQGGTDYFVKQVGNTLQFWHAGHLQPRLPCNLLIRVTGGQCCLQWSPVTQDTNGDPLRGVTYRVYASDHPGFMPSASILVATTDVPSFNDPNPTPSQRFYKVVASITENTLGTE